MTNNYFSYNNHNYKFPPTSFSYTNQRNNSNNHQNRKKNVYNNTQSINNTPNCFNNNLNCNFQKKSSNNSNLSNSTENSCIKQTEKTKVKNKSTNYSHIYITQIGNIKIYNDDLLILGIIYFLYQQSETDNLLIMLLFSLLF